MIYERPDDYPRHFVVRHFRIEPGQAVPLDVVGLADTLDEARRLVPPTADICLGRYLHDAPTIVETWI